VRVVAAPITLFCAEESTSSAGWDWRQIGGNVRDHRSQRM
jgi:hypothetical protein